MKSSLHQQPVNQKVCGSVSSDWWPTLSGQQLVDLQNIYSCGYKAPWHNIVNFLFLLLMLWQNGKLSADLSVIQLPVNSVTDLRYCHVLHHCQSDCVVCRWSMTVTSAISAARGHVSMTLQFICRHERSTVTLAIFEKFSTDLQRHCQSPSCSEQLSFQYICIAIVNHHLCSERLSFQQICATSLSITVFPVNG